jgi:hypothetical protein
MLAEWKLFLAFSAVAIPSLAICETYRIEPGKVVVKRFANIPQGDAERPELPKVTASFALESDPDGDGPTRLSTGGTRAGVSGGACLIFQAVDYPKACTTHADCEQVTGARAVAESASTGYCLRDESSDGTPDRPLPEKVCWFREESSCVRSPVNVLTLNEVVQMPAVDAFPLGVDKPMLWRVMSCQNLTDSDCGRSTAQEGVNRRTRLGPVTLVE